MLDGLDDCIGAIYCITAAVNASGFRRKRSNQEAGTIENLLTLPTCSYSRNSLITKLSLR